MRRNPLSGMSPMTVRQPAEMGSPPRRPAAADTRSPLGAPRAAASPPARSAAARRAAAPQSRGGASARTAAG
ncbi:MAG TPA: hypothetical protein VM390_10485, partial [Acidimicrobiales bacterium]|nr:hypothetical protein [Acidimicrobiales bacterium]